MTSRSVPALVLLVSATAANAAPAKPAATPAPAKPAVAKSLPPVYDPLVVGTEELVQKLFAAEQSGRRLVVNFGTNDCLPCHTAWMATVEKKFLDEYIRTVLPTTIDVTPGSPNAELLKTYGIDPAKGLPAFVVFGSDRVEIAATRSGEGLAAAKKGPAAVQELLRSWAPPTEDGKSPAKNP